MDVLARLDQTRKSISVLEHPFYQRWSAGELSPEELGFYAWEYRHAVIALADASARAAAKAEPAHAVGLRLHAEEEAAHVELWDSFARVTGRLRLDGERRRRWRRPRRAFRRGRPARTCSSSSQCCTRSRRASPRSRGRRSRA